MTSLIVFGALLAFACKFPSLFKVGYSLFMIPLFTVGVGCILYLFTGMTFFMCLVSAFFFAALPFTYLSLR